MSTHEDNEHPVNPDTKSQLVKGYIMLWDKAEPLRGLAVDIPAQYPGLDKNERHEGLLKRHRGYGLELPPLQYEAPPLVYDWAFDTSATNIPPSDPAPDTLPGFDTEDDNTPTEPVTPVNTSTSPAENDAPAPGVRFFMIRAKRAGLSGDDTDYTYNVTV